MRPTRFFGSRCRIIARLLPSAAIALVICGCANKEKLEPPTALASPYERMQLWAVAPFNNESGVSIVKSDRVADLFAEQAEQVHGINAIPLNRVMLAMRKLEMRTVASPRDAASLMNALGVDGLIVGTITAYDPYQPPKIGAAIQLYQRDRPHRQSDIDPVEITRAPTEIALPGMLGSDMPMAQASGVFDAGNHETLAQLDEYAAGRTEPNSAYGKRIYTVNMEMYTQFVAYRLMHDLLESERIRLMPPATQPSSR
jgi:hypothetical protein